MHRLVPVFGLLSVALLTNEAFAQRFDDTAVCSRLMRSSRPQGLYIAYLANTPALKNIQDRAICADDGSFCLAAINGKNTYELRSRFFYVAAKARSEEGVWHVRTQTSAKNLEGADFAFVSRPAYPSTRCSPNQLPSLQGNDRLVNVNRYIDHHPGPETAIPPDPGLSESFHFKIQGNPGPCVNTDDATVFRDLKSLYGFENVARIDQGIAWAFSTSAIASPIRYAGLSSEFAYQSSDEQVCFGFSAPFPTKSGAYAGDNWQPKETLVVIKRLQGRKVSGAYRNLIPWSQ